MLGVIYPWDNFLGAVIFGAICPRDDDVSNKLSERKLSSRAVSRGILPGGNYLWGNFPEAIIRGQSSIGAIILRAIFLWGNYLLDHLSEGQ